MSRSTTPWILPLLALALACGGGGDEAEEAPADTTAQDQVQFVPDSVILQDVTTRLSADPRLDAEGVEIEVHAVDGEVTLLGSVPTRREMQIAREVAISAPGVKRVYLDSLRVLSDPEPEPTGNAT